MGFLHFLLFIFLLGLFMVGIIIYNVWNTIHGTINNVKEQMGMGKDTKRHEPHRTYGNQDGVVADQPKHNKQKIFDKDEGEYVDFTEEK